MSTVADRKLARPEIDIVLHLMKVGAGGLLPVKLMPKARPIATALWRLSIVDIWQRQSLASGRLEGPFCSLTGLGRYRGAAFAEERRNWRAELPAFALRDRDCASQPIEIED